MASSKLVKDYWQSDKLADKSWSDITTTSFMNVMTSYMGQFESFLTNLSNNQDLYDQAQKMFGDVSSYHFSDYIQVFGKMDDWQGIQDIVSEWYTEGIKTSVK